MIKETMKLENGQNGSIITYKGITPKIHESAFLCEGVRIVGDVEIGENYSAFTPFANSEFILNSLLVVSASV
jgi:hypothetical protein